MTASPRRLLTAARALARLRRTEIDDALKRTFTRAWLDVYVLRAHDPADRRASVGPLDVRYVDYGLLEFLFNEVFVENGYHFSTDRDDPYVIDCGANIGMSVLYFKLLYPNARIAAFEPGEEAHACLADNVARNGLASVQTHRAALAPTDGEVDLYDDPVRPGSLHASTSPARGSSRRRSVPGVRLSSFIDGEVDFLKMDIEGAEQGVLEEVHASGRLRQIRQMAVEYHHHIHPDDDRLSSLLALLEDAGFGYQIGGALGRPVRHRRFQDLLIHAYRKD